MIILCSMKTSSIFLIQLFLIGCSSSDPTFEKESLSSNNNQKIVTEQDASTDSQIEYTLDQCREFYRNCISQCLNFSSKSPERENCNKQCLHDYQICAHCPFTN